MQTDNHVVQKFDTRKIYKLSNEVIFFAPFLSVSPFLLLNLVRRHCCAYAIGLYTSWPHVKFCAHAQCVLPRCSCPQGGGRAWGGDLIVFVGPGVKHLIDLVLPREGIFESFFARRGDIWLPTRTKKTETEHMFPASTLHACAVRFEKIRKSWRPMRTSEGWVDFTVLSSNFVCFSVFLIN